MSELGMDPSEEYLEDMEPTNTDYGENGSYLSNSPVSSSPEGETASGEEQQQRTEDILQSYSTPSDESYGANNDDDDDGDGNGDESVSETASSGSSARMENSGFDGLLSNHYFDGWKMVDGEKQISFPADVVMFDSIYSTRCELIFSESFFEAKSQPDFGCQDDFCVRLSLDNIVKIESYWRNRFQIAEVTVSATSKNKDPGPECQFSVIKKLEFHVGDPYWNEKVEAIQSFQAYNALWTVKTDAEIEQYGDTSVQKMLPSEFPTFKPFEDLIYPEGDADPVCMSKRDVDLLQPDTFVNDTIIDFYIKYLVKKMQAEKRQRFHFFNSFFFRKLADLEKYPSGSFDGRSAFLRVRKWTRKVNLFEKDFIFIPVNHNYHWSLLLICHPGEVANFRDEDAKKLDKVPCILHMDSIRGTHVDLKDRIRSYLCEEWKEKHKETSEEISSKFLNMNFVSLELPQQQNSYDCGLFLLHYVELFLEEDPTSINPFKISPITHFLTTNWFPSAEPSLKRRAMEKLIFELLDNHPIESTPASGADTSHPCDELEIENALDFPFSSLSKGCEEHLLPSQSEAELEMTLLPASLGMSYCARSNDMGVGELFESGSATGSSLDRQYQTLDRMSSFNDFKSALASIEEAVGTEEKFGQSMQNGQDYQHFEEVASETADYACLSEVSWNSKSFIHHQPCQGADAALPVKSVFCSDNFVEELQKNGNFQAVKLDENMDQIRRISTEEDQCMISIVTNVSVMQEVEETHCSGQPIDQNDSSDSLSACQKNLSEILNVSNGAVEGNVEADVDEALKAAKSMLISASSDVELSESNHCSGQPIDQSNTINTLNECPKNPSETGAVVDNIGASYVDAEELESKMQHARKRMQISPSSEVKLSKSDPHCSSQPMDQSDNIVSLNGCPKNPSELLNLSNGHIKGSVGAACVDAEGLESEVQHAAKRPRLSPSSEVGLPKNMPEDL